MRQRIGMKFIWPLALLCALFVIGVTGCGRPAGKSAGGAAGTGGGAGAGPRAAAGLGGAGGHDSASGTGRAGGPAWPHAVHVPQRIISCAPNLTEMLFALGAGDRVIGVTRYCQYPPEAKTRPPLGDLYTPNLEAMVAAKPDLIIFVPGSRKIADFFAAHPGPRLIETDACETVGEIQATLLQLGRALGDSARADSLVRAMRTGLDSVRTEFAGAAPVRYLMVLGHDEGSLEQIYVVGRPTYLTELLALSGGDNVVAEASGRYPILTREAILVLDPDVIIERHLGAATPADRAALVKLWDSLPTLKAVRERRIVIQDDDHVTINGPDLVPTARKLARLVRGDGSAASPADARP